MGVCSRGGLAWLIALLMVPSLSCQSTTPKPPKVASAAPRACACACKSTPAKQRPHQSVVVHVAQNIERLLAEEDIDGDKRITVEDGRCAGASAGQGDKRFWLRARDGRRYEISGTYQLANLLQELKLAQDRSASETATVSFDRLFENPVRRLSRSIREIFWDGLTRRIDADHLAQILQDTKTSSHRHRYLYVPAGDPAAYKYYRELALLRPQLRLKVERLPAEITPEYVRQLDGRHGLLALALRRRADGGLEGVPFVVPGGRFNEMYGWDSYFEALGLLADGRVALAQAMVDNFVYQITHYGKILNANRTYYLTRSQPPFLTSMALAVYEQLPAGRKRERWLKGVLEAAVHEYEQVWTSKPRLTSIGLSRYHGSGKGAPPEVEPGHFDAIYRPHAKRLGLSVRVLEQRYKSGRLDIPELDRFFVHDRCVRESGHDTTYRWDRDGDRCSDFVTVDLNSLLYKMELDIARIIDNVFDGRVQLEKGATHEAAAWYDKAAQRKKLMLRYLWDDKRGMFFDYDLVAQRRYEYISATTFYPLWAWHPDDPSRRLLTPTQAKRLVASVLPHLETAGGVLASAESSRGPVSDGRPLRQWDYPHGWPPHQMLVWRGLLNYGEDATAQRLTYRWLYAITRNAVDYHGTVPEKLDVVKRSHQVFAEYGNVGTKFAYITREGFGWMNASYQLGLGLLPARLRSALAQLEPPEWLFGDPAGR